MALQDPPSPNIDHLQLILPFDVFLCIWSCTPDPTHPDSLRLVFNMLFVSRASMPCWDYYMASASFGDLLGPPKFMMLGGTCRAVKSAVDGSFRWVEHARLGSSRTEPEKVFGVGWRVQIQRRHDWSPMEMPNIPHPTPLQDGPPLRPEMPGNGTRFGHGHVRI